jgi:alkanesulfonate monooxygenase SsuD/methylene tetrahydromethanopterin reductase-like flavin-dependent oxidoreductase (luciferase family)
MYGIEGLDHRVGRLRESLEIITSLFTQERTTYDGRYYRMKDAIANPKPIQKPHPPLWIGASGPNMLKLVARHADVWNIGDDDHERLAELSAALEQACAEIGRNPAEIRHSIQFGWDGNDRNQLIDRCGRHLEQGVTEQVIYLRQNPEATAEKAAEALPELRRLKPVQTVSAQA